jgi:predicted polyphosphate/ATP-dependent NAD kinase
MFRIGLIVNPVAGMGGRVGLKGTDGADCLARARELGAVPLAPGRAGQALRLLLPAREEFSLHTCPGSMGETAAAEAGLPFETIGLRVGPETGPDDTKAAARILVGLGVDLLLFAGGDGTARDIAGAVGERVLCLGIPAGVKIHSAVFASTPLHAGEMALALVRGRRSAKRLAEVMDIDEEAFRQGEVRSCLFGYLLVPEDRRRLQGLKSGSPKSEVFLQKAIAADLLEGMEPGVLTLIGPGSTTRELKRLLGFEGTLLGVDAVKDGRLVAEDCSEKRLLELIAGEPSGSVRIVVSPIGGQGFLFGRGNQQFSPEVLRLVGPKNIRVAAAPGKIAALCGAPLRLDTGDPRLDRQLSGYTRVTTGYHEAVMAKVSP